MERDNPILSVIRPVRTARNTPSPSHPSSNQQYIGVTQTQ